ncbi:cupin domain-containing protein [Algoriphagus sp. D3-2-R+10]|uniref:cupin domain-containing protein n=1 Tax=Algoriphagus aurantiacus TaxID=3103948 RepID=UPI002B36E96B|nr:cupin domain-containing protein [Algoriphagus sp. D3-2-R+10]MEB2778165.1 cupin domain-containing protein [Algoriphagus sp. D3-2-R+10]
MKSVFIFFFCLMTLTAFAQLKPIKSGVFKWNDHEVITNEDRVGRPILEGVSPHFEYLEMHATTQAVGAKPSTAHANEDIEEIVIVKEGLMKVTIEGESSVLGANGVLSLMPLQMHSLSNVGDSPLTYFVIRYRAKKKMDVERGMVSGGSLMINADSLAFKPSERGGSRAYFDRPTAMCERLEMHVTTLDTKGPSHEPHAHVETEIILMISGETAMTIDGKEYSASAGDFYFVESQLFHGIRNLTDQPTSYFAFKWK